MIDLYDGEALETMDMLIAKGVIVDAIIADIPYGTTQCAWDSVIPFTWYIRDKKDRILYIQDALLEGYTLEYFNEKKRSGMWERLNKLIKPNGAIVLFGSEPFSSALRMSNIKNYKYDWIWQKNKSTGFLNAKKQPLRQTENISLFYKNQCLYSPQMTGGHKPVSNFRKNTSDGNTLGKTKIGITGGGSTDRYPTNIITISVVNNDNSGDLKIHPTQKPVALGEYLLKTYTNEGDTVLDFTMGSGFTMRACNNLKRHGIGIDNGGCEKESSKYYKKPWKEVVEDLIKEDSKQPLLF